MNAREKILLIALIVIVGIPGLYFGGKRWWWTPLMEYKEQAKKLQEEVETVNASVDQFLDGQARLNKARLRSLPAIPEQAAAEYQLQYLKPMLKKSGLSVDEVTQSQSVVKMKPVTPIPGVTTVGHKILTFSVRASGELPALVAALDQMQKTPYEHRIKSLTIDRAEPAGSKKSSGKLNIQMNIEVLLVAGTKNQPGTPLDPKLIQPFPEDRQYAQIAKRNIFEGALPLETWVDPSKGKDAEDLAKKLEEEKRKNELEPTVATPQFVHLTHTSPDEQIAYMRNRLSDKPEMKLWAKAGSGYDTFRIMDEDSDYIFFRAKVLRVDLRQVYIQIMDEVYAIEIGKSLADMKHYGANMSRYDLEDEGLFDRGFWEAEKAALKTKSGSKDDKGKTPTKPGDKRDGPNKTK